MVLSETHLVWLEAPPHCSGRLQTTRSQDMKTMQEERRHTGRSCTLLLVWRVSCCSSKLAPQVLYLLLQVPEHTWGVDIKIYLNDYANWTNEQFQQQLADRCRLQAEGLSLQVLSASD